MEVPTGTITQLLNYLLNGAGVLLTVARCCWWSFHFADLRM